MSSGLYSGVSGLALGTGLYRDRSGLWSGASGLAGGGGGTPTPTPGPTLTWVSDDTVYDPIFGLTPIALGDEVELEISEEADFDPLYGTGTNTVSTEEAVTGQLTFAGIPSLDYDTLYYARARINGGAWSNVESLTMAPLPGAVLTNPVANATGPTTASLSIGTNVGDGTLYPFVGTSATPPSETDIKAGTGATWAVSQAVPGTGTQNSSATGLTASTTYYPYWLQTRAAGVDSAIVSGSSFTTSTPVAPDVAIVDASSNTSGASPRVLTGIAIGSAEASRKVWIYVYTPGNTVSGVTVNSGAITATLVASTNSVYSLFVADVPTGTTCDISIATSGGWNQVIVATSVGLATIASTPTAAYSYRTAANQGIAVTVPAGGRGLVFGWDVNPAGVGTWTNATFGLGAPALPNNNVIEGATMTASGTATTSIWGDNESAFIAVGLDV